MSSVQVIQLGHSGSALYNVRNFPPPPPPPFCYLSIVSVESFFFYILRVIFSIAYPSHVQMLTRYNYLRSAQTSFSTRLQNCFRMTSARTGRGFPVWLSRMWGLLLPRRRMARRRAMPRSRRRRMVRDALELELELVVLGRWCWVWLWRLCCCTS